MAQCGVDGGIRLWPSAATVLTLLTVGLRMGIGPFFLPMADGLGFSRSLLSGIVAIGMLCYGLGMPLAGYLVSIRGTRFVLLTGTAIVVASSIWTVYARGPLEFLLSFGVALSIALARLIESLLYATSPADPLTFGAAALVLAVVALAAGYLPALRASRVEPMRALRAE